MSIHPPMETYLDQLEVPDRHPRRPREELRQCTVVIAAAAAAEGSQVQRGAAERGDGPGAGGHGGRGLREEAEVSAHFEKEPERVAAVGLWRRGRGGGGDGGEAQPEDCVEVGLCGVRVCSLMVNGSGVGMGDACVLALAWKSACRSRMAKGCRLKTSRFRGKVCCARVVSCICMRTWERGLV